MGLSTQRDTKNAVFAVAVRRFSTKGLHRYDTLVLGSWVIAGKPVISGWVRKNRRHLAGKAVVLFTTSGADKDDPAHQQNFQAAFPEDLRQGLHFVPLNGRMVISRLTWLDSQLMKIGIKMIAKTDPEKASRMGQDVDRVRLTDALPIVEYLKGRTSS